MNRQWLMAAQQRLERIGLYTAGVDGDWGPGSETAIDAAIAFAEKAKGVAPPAYPALPAQYRWLLTIGQLPLIVHEGLKLLGTREIPGAKHSPEILSWLRELGLGEVVTDDETAWCGTAVAIMAKRAQKDISPVGNVLGSRNWLKFGVAVDKPGLGDVMVFWRGNPKGWQGHVGLYIGEDKNYWHILGGNQSNAVSIMRLAKVQDGAVRLLGARRPVYINQPGTVKAYLVEPTGSISRNEA